MTSKKNFTLQIDSELLEKVRALAERERKSINAFVTEVLRQGLRKDADYEHAKRRSLARMQRGYDLGFEPVSRDELHER